jgi:general secretion pathway protein J
MTRGHRGFTLLELLIALAIVGALLAIAFGGLRTALAAWRQGEDRAESHQHARGVAVLLGRAIGATYPYRAASTSPQPVVLFRGSASRIEFVTEAPPVPHGIPIAFTAVVVSREDGEPGGLVIRQRALPNREPFADAQVVFRDPAVATLGFRYLDADGAWQDAWDSDTALPRAVAIAVGTSGNGRTGSLPPLTVPLRVTTAGP